MTQTTPQKKKKSGRYTDTIITACILFLTVFGTIW